MSAMLSRIKTFLSFGATEKAANPIMHNHGGGGWWNVIREPFAGAWQRNIELCTDTILAQSTVFSCISLITGDISKLPWQVRRLNDQDGIWAVEKNPAYSAVLRRPNQYQNRIQFVESWIQSKLIYGNTYVLKGRDSRGVVNRLWVLNPKCVQPLVTELGDVYYRLNKDALSESYQDEAVVPASEVIHDRFNTFFHPLVGLSPLYAAASVAGHSLEIQNSSTAFFAKGARPSGVLIAPGAISEANAKALKDYWGENFSGANSGRVAVLGDGLKYEPMQMKSTDAQLIEQMKWDAEVIVSLFHVPGYKVGVGNPPSYNNAQAFQLQYYTDCLQTLIEALELSLAEGLGMGDNQEVHLDTDALLRMDAVTQMDILVKGNTGGVYKPNESRKAFNLPPVKGGDAVYLQQQNYSLSALADRDSNDPFGKEQTQPANEAATEPVQPGNQEPSEEDQKSMLALFAKAIGADKITP